MLAAVVGFIDAWRFIYCPPDMGVLLGIASAVAPTDMDFNLLYVQCAVAIFPFYHGLHYY